MRYIVVSKLFKHVVFDTTLFKICLVTLSLTKANQKKAYLNANPETIPGTRDWIVARENRYFSTLYYLNNGFEPFGVQNGVVYFKKTVT